MELQPVILSGGSGTRLWPLSREQYPKQLLALVGEGEEAPRLAECREVAADSSARERESARIERGEMRLDDNYLDLIARALGCEPVELLTDTPVAKTETQAELFRTIAELPDDSAAALLAAASAMRKG